MQKFKIYFWKSLPKGYFKEVREKYKNRKNDYMNVYICDTREEMYNLEDKIEGKPIKRDYCGRTWCYNRNFFNSETGEYVKTSPLCGNIVLTKEYLYMNAITHESTHAVIGYFNQKLKDCQGIFTECDDMGKIIGEEPNEREDLEELFAYMVGNLADQIAYNYKED